eukprot:NODE_13289_length_1174_cov_3.597899.p1 GENE.NODE_13289_length_1174_cov_3.597899~~NODE_13289_length_1174_cov_3.597899.p1  ORF type:complete len:82 (-),score=22.31 NODE_13289_length_1174_cov_3.597899:824-1069(-)
MVLTPTRDMCNQIYKDGEKFGQPVGLLAACAGGGALMRDQEWAIKCHPDSLIATPGHLNDFMNSRIVSAGICQDFVLDEAD